MINGDEDSNVESIRLNERPITDSTNFVDASPSGRDREGRYEVRPIFNGVEEIEGDPIPVMPNNFLSIPLQTPDRYTPNDGSVGDLDGDGHYEVVLHQAGRGADNSRSGFTDPPILEAYRFDGTLLWRINLGRNIREGAHYTQFIVYDLDGDGRAEIACKTADGTVDGVGTTIGELMTPVANTSADGFGQADMGDVALHLRKKGTRHR